MSNILLIKNIEITFFKLFIIIIVLPLMIKLIYYYFTHFTQIIEIKNKYKKLNSDKFDFDDILIVTDKHNDNFNVTNLFFKLDFNKKKDWQNLEIGNTYKINGYGISVPYIGMYKNIYEIISKY